jgi:hypothetical protein
METCITTKIFFQVLQVNFTTVPRTLCTDSNLTIHSRQKMALATLLRLLPDYDLQPQLLQPWSLAGVAGSTLVAWYHRCDHRISNPDRDGRPQQPRSDQILRWIPGVRPRCWRHSRSQSLHSGQSDRCYHLFRNTNLLWRPNHDCLHAWHIRKWVQRYSKSVACERWDHVEGLVEFLHLLDGQFRQHAFKILSTNH